MRLGIRGSFNQEGVEPSLKRSKLFVLRTPLIMLRSSSIDANIKENSYHVYEVSVPSGGFKSKVMMSSELVKNGSK